MTELTIKEAKYCGDLFSNDKDKAKWQYRELSKKFHPDNGGDSNLFSIVTELYSRAEKCFESGIWEESSTLHFISESGTRYKFKYSYTNKFELGVMYSSKKNICFLLDKQHEKYYNNYIRSVGSLTYASSEMEKELSRYFPSIAINFKTKEGRFIIVLDKTEDSVPLSQVLGKVDSIESEHLAWMISRLSNISCYLEYLGISHNGISVDNCFVSPQHHTVMLYGGWWYCVGSGKNLIGVGREVYDTMPISAKTNKVGSIQTDLESIKYIGRKLSTTKTPLNMKKWFEGGSTDKAQDDYAKWEKAIEKDYGKRKFIIWKFDTKELYK